MPEIELVSDPEIVADPTKDTDVFVEKRVRRKPAWFTDYVFSTSVEKEAESGEDIGSESGVREESPDPKLLIGGTGRKKTRTDLVTVPQKRAPSNSLDREKEKREVCVTVQNRVEGDIKKRAVRVIGSRDGDVYASSLACRRMAKSSFCLGDILPAEEMVDLGDIITTVSPEGDVTLKLKY